METQRMKKELLWFKAVRALYLDPPLPEGPVEPHLQVPGLTCALSAHNHDAA